MNVFLWGLQIALAATFAMAGVVKLSRPKERVLADMPSLEGYTAGTIRLIGSLELLAAIGLILPAVTGIAPVLTPLAAIGLAVLMALAINTHRRRKEPGAIAYSALLLVAAVVVAWGRLGPYAF